MDIVPHEADEDPKWESSPRCATDQGKRADVGVDDVVASCSPPRAGEVPDHREVGCEYQEEEHPE